MAQTKTASAKTETPKPPFDGEAIFEMTAKQMQSVSHMNDAILKSMADVHEEVSRFVGQRLKQDRDLQSKIADCKNPQETWEACASFVRDTMTDYADEMRKLGDIMTENGLNGLSKGANGGAAAKETSSPAA